MKSDLEGRNNWWLYRPGCPVQPINPGQRPALYRPYDIYLHLQQETA